MTDDDAIDPIDAIRSAPPPPSVEADAERIRARNDLVERHRRRVLLVLTPGTPKMSGARGRRDGLPVVPAGGDRRPTRRDDRGGHLPLDEMGGTAGYMPYVGGNVSRGV